MSTSARAASDARSRSSVASRRRRQGRPAPRPCFRIAPHRRPRWTRRRRRAQLPPREVRAEGRPRRRRRRPRRRRRRSSPIATSAISRSLPWQEPLRARAGPARRGGEPAWRRRRGRRAAGAGRHAGPRRGGRPRSPISRIPGRRVVVARGGRGGAGNRRFAEPDAAGAAGGRAGARRARRRRSSSASSCSPTPRCSASRTPASRRCCARLSNATPKVADYPFTTLAPVLGTVEAPDGRQLVVADVPGLLEGASEGVGLGDEFLAHLERARLLVHVIDVHEGDPEQRFHAIDRELGAYGAGLAERPQIVVLNKIDLRRAAPSFELDDPRILRRRAHVGGDRRGHRRAVRALFDGDPGSSFRAAGHRRGRARGLPRLPAARPRRRPFRVLRTDRGFLVTGRDLDSVPQDEIESALRAAGARAGDEIAIGDELARAGVTTGLARRRVRPAAQRPPRPRRRGDPPLRAGAARVVVTGDPPAQAGRDRRGDPVSAWPRPPSPAARGRAVPLRDRAGGPVVHRSDRRAGRGERYGDVVFVVGADEFASFLSWHDPDARSRPRCASGSRRGPATRESVSTTVLARLERPERVELFAIPALAVSSTDVRDRVARGEPIDDLVPAPVAALIDELGLYRAGVAGSR